MSAGGQKQEIRVLAIAIGALVILVALFVGVRSFSSKPAPAAAAGKTEKKAQKPKAAKGKQTADKAKPAPLPPSNRDPFASVGASEVSLAGRSGNPRALPDPRRDPRGARLDPRLGAGPEPDPDMRLAGIMRGNSAMALIHVDDQRYYAQLGDFVGGYRLVQIGRTSVVLAKDGRFVTLNLQPEPGSGASKARARTRTIRRR